jgi:hypothetical protein
LIYNLEQNLKSNSIFFMNNTNNISARQSYERSRNMFAMAMLDKFQGNMQKATEWANSLKLSQSEIRLECGFSTTSTTFNFGLTQNQKNTANVQYATEERLTMQDSLCCNEYGVYVAQTAGDQDAAYQMRTYGNQIDFGAAFANQLDQVFFNNGNLAITCNKDIIMPYRSLFNHLYRPQTQQTAALGANSPGDEIRGCESGMITAEPNFVLIGSKGYNIQINLKAALSAATSNSRIIIWFRGVLAQNSTSVS